MSSVSQLSAGLRPSGHRQAHAPFLIIGMPPFLHGLGFTVQPNLARNTQVELQVKYLYNDITMCYYDDYMPNTVWWVNCS